MTDTTVIALIGAATTISASLIAAYSANKAAKRAAEAVEKTELNTIKTQENTVLAKATSEKLNVVDTTTKETYQVTNSHLSEITSQLKVALERISGLEQTAAALDKARSVSDKERSMIREQSVLENGTPPQNKEPIPVHDAAVLEVLTPKLDQIQDSVDKEKEKPPNA